MLCGGTGITPMFQIIKHIVSDPKDKTRLNLIYANISPDDVLLKRDLDRLAAQHPTQLDVFYVVEKEVILIALVKKGDLQISSLAFVVAGRRLRTGGVE